MVNRTDYQKYLKGMSGKRLNELAIFEIGGAGRVDGGSAAPIIDSLPQRKAKRVIYRGIDVRNFYGEQIPREEYRPSSTQKVREYKPVDAGVDKFIVEWDGRDIPYPFSEGSFDEFHSHMVTANLVVPEQTEYIPSPECFADEVNRLLRNNGRFYLSTDTPHFFGASDGLFSAIGKDRANLADRLIQKFRSNGFSIEVIDSHGFLKENLQGKNYGVPIGDVNYGSLGYFSGVVGSADVDFALIATKAPHPVLSK